MSGSRAGLSCGPMTRSLAALSALVLTACVSAPKGPPAVAAPVQSSAVAPAVAPPVAARAPAPVVAEAPARPVDPRTARIVRLCRLWGEVRFLDPEVAAGAVDWDAALVAALPKALAAQTDEEEIAAVRALLGSLHDPVTRVEHAVPAARSVGSVLASSTVAGVAVIPVAAATWPEIGPAAKRLESQLASAKLAVIDLRARSPEEGSLTRMVFDAAAGHLTPHETADLTSRFVEHHGYPPQEGTTSGSYVTLIATVLPTIYPAAGGPHPAQVAFLTNSAGGVPDVAWAMQRAGDAVIVSQGALAPGAVVRTRSVSLPGDYVAYLRATEPTGVTPRPDVVLPDGATDAKAMEAAIQAVKRPSTRRGAKASSPAGRTPTWHFDAAYADSAYPSRELRMLGLFRLWNVIHFFYPYLPLMGDAWDDALAELAPRFETAANAREYALAVAELAARIPDGHVDVWGADSLPIGGTARPPIATRLIEGRQTVTAHSDDAVGVEIGDIVVAVDGESVLTRRERLRKYIAASNDVTGSQWASSAALAGDPGSKAVLSLRGKDGKMREVTLTRALDRVSTSRTGPTYRILEGNIGYADLDRLENGEVDAMFAAFEKTKAIIFDMRGYPHGTAWTIAPRLNVRKAKTGAQFYEPLVTYARTGSSFFQLEMPPTDKPLYAGKTVMLIDERTMSQAEHTGLFFEAANGTKFIGSQTAGANGDVTNLVLPGGLYVRFSGHDVRHADGRQLQRVGLVPDVEVKPTIAGIRAGRDEVLERALAFLRDGK